MKLAISVCALAGLVSLALGQQCQNLIVPVSVSTNITITNSTTLAQTKQPLTASYNISARLCLPQFSLPQQTKTVQFLIHGLSYDKSYWDFPVTPYINSYVNYANQFGYATFAIDRLGVGLSTHPANVNEVQGATHIQVIHALAAGLRSGAYGKTFSKVILVGHSYGSCISNGVAAAYPGDADALILTGYSHELYTPASAVASLAPAKSVSPSRFGSLPDGYLTISTVAARTDLFYHAPFFSTVVATTDFNTEQTVVLPELYDLIVPGGPLVVTAPNFTGPVHYVNGDFDALFCGEPTFTQCTAPGNTALTGEPRYWPRANVSHTVIPFTGHDVNLHYTAPAAYADMLTWTALHGF